MCIPHSEQKNMICKKKSFIILTICVLIPCAIFFVDRNSSILQIDFGTLDQISNKNLDNKNGTQNGVPQFRNFTSNSTQEEIISFQKFRRKFAQQETTEFRSLSENFTQQEITEFRNLTSKFTGQNVTETASVNSVLEPEYKSAYNCTLKHFSISSTDLPFTGLYSFPGSGNTWTRHLIQQLTGIGTSSVYCDSKLRSHGFRFECDRRWHKLVAVKSHGPKIDQFEKVVLLVRNPYDAFLAYSSYAAAGHTGQPSAKKLLQGSVRRIEGYCQRYVTMMKAATKNTKRPVYILQYERLQTDLATELRNLATFLNVTVTEKDIFCTVKMQEGLFHRKTSEEKHAEQLRTLYTPEQLRKIREVARTSEELLKHAFGKNIDLGGSAENLLFSSR